MPRPLIAVPVKPFGVAKHRLATVMDAPTRSIIGRRIAARTLETARQAGASVVVVAGDRGVRQWAGALGFASIPELEPSLAGAARAAVDAAAVETRSWIVAHADLPLVEVGDFRAVIGALEEAEVVIAPSYNGGTTVVGGTMDTFDFRYGEGSFRHHLGIASRRRVRIVVRLGLGLDLDGPSDLESAIRHPRGAWLRALVDQ
ncbi:MAG: 2-phospho-L-lactate guanylyltransferase [Gammaproteobacteria bacterium]|nr:2-phospho-L-lactate guanylyltransferase [Gammaproteobacteria bacterium]